MPRAKSLGSLFAKMAPVEVDYFHKHTRESLDNFDIESGALETIELLPPAKLEISADDQKRKGTLNVNGNRDYAHAVLYNGEDDEEGTDLDLSGPIEFGKDQAVEIESVFHDEMIALRYHGPEEEAQPRVKEKDLVLA